MKLLLSVLLLTITALNASEIFLLPDNETDALYFLKKHIASAEKSITIVTPELNSKTIRKNLQKSFDKGIVSTIITRENPVDDAAYFAQFAQVKVLIAKGLQSDYRRGGLSLSMLIVDEKHACISTAAFNEETMRHDVAVLECTDDPQRLKHYLGILKTLLGRSGTYLQ
jgi:sugar-specific transcriptional regulator TrmB